MKYLKSKKAILVIEDCDQLIEEDETEFVEFVEKLFKNTSDVFIILTSRKPLGQLDDLKEKNSIEITYKED